ncbi:MAG: hypothetical protein Q8N53_15895 [Longimicrobiales bacterium]|nr:hypothetical protein [Longimicrobiales bacterium]
MVDHPGRGSVLAVVVLAVVALGLLAHGSLLLARVELAASRAGARLLQARAAAEAGFGDALAGGSSAALRTIPLGDESPLGSGSVGDHPYRAGARRLARELWLVTGEGRARGSDWGLRVGAPVWLLDPIARVQAQAGVVEVAGEGEVDVRGTVDGRTLVPDAVPLGEAACAEWSAALDSLPPLPRLPSVARVDRASTGEPRLGRLEPGNLADALGTLTWDEGTPRPAEADGGCDLADPWNLGDPENALGPCAAHLPGVFREGDLTFLGGTGQGLLVVRGNLTLVGTRFHGVALVGGALILRDGAWLLGSARVGGGLEVDARSRVTGSGCRVLRALGASLSRLSRPIPLARPMPMEPSR